MFSHFFCQGNLNKKVVVFIFGPTALNSASSVRSFVPNADISGSTCQNFLIFCTKLEQHKCRKVTFPDSRKKLLTSCGWGQKIKFGPKLDFFKDCFQTACQNFSIFCMKLDNNKAFQTMYMLSSGKPFPRPSRGQKVKFGPKLNVFRIVEQSLLWVQ